MQANENYCRKSGSTEYVQYEVMKHARMVDVASYS